MKVSFFYRISLGSFERRKKWRHIKATFVRQQGAQDCGLACLLSLLRYYAADAAEAEIAETLGMGREGTPVLALVEAAEHAGFRVKAFRAATLDPNFLNDPSILYYPIGGKGHFVSIYGRVKTGGRDVFVVGDPAKGLSEFSLNEIERFGIDKILITCQPDHETGRFSRLARRETHWFRTHIEAWRDSWLVSLLLGAALAGLGISVAISVQHIVSLTLKKPIGGNVFVSVFALFCLMLLRGLAQYFRELYFIRYTYDNNLELLSSFIGRLMGRSKAFFRAHAPGDLMLRLTDLATVQKSTAMLSDMLVLDSVMLVFYITFLMSYSLTIGVIVLICVTFSWMLALQSAPRLFMFRKRMMNDHISAYGRFADTLQGIDTLLDSGVQAVFSRGILRHFRVFYGRSAAFRRLAIRMSFAGDLSGVLLYGLSFLYAVWLMRSGGLTVPEFIGILMLLNPVVAIMQKIGYLQSQWTETGAAFGRIRLSGPEENRSPGRAVGEIRELSLRQISFGFPGRKLLIRTATLTIRKGELVQLHGANGTGKSTLLQLILGHYSTSGGGIYVNNDPREVYLADELRRRIAIVPQKASLFSASVRDNISLYRPGGPYKRVEDMLAGTGLDALFSGWMPGLDVALGPEGQQLSGGQAQLVILARALYTDPDILLFDEPLNALDAGNMAEYIRLIQVLRKEKGILMIHHGRDHGLRPDRVYRLKGRFLLSENAG